MEIRQGYRLTTLRGVDNFLDEYADRLPSVSPTGIRLRLREQIAAIEESADAQAGCALTGAGETARQKELRRVLMQEHLAPIVRIARAELSREPELAAIKRLPPTSLSHEVLIAAALGVAVSAEAHAEVFVAAGLPPNFVDQLREAGAALEAAIDKRRAAYGHRHGATVGIAALLGAASRSVCVLDALVKKDLRLDAQLLAAWIAVKTPAVKPGRPRGATMETSVPKDSVPLMIAA